MLGGVERYLPHWGEEYAGILVHTTVIGAVVRHEMNPSGWHPPAVFGARTAWRGAVVQHESDSQTGTVSPADTAGNGRPTTALSHRHARTRRPKIAPILCAQRSAVWAIVWPLFCGKSVRKAELSSLFRFSANFIEITFKNLYVFFR